jgi:hypothetical protein
MTGTNYEVMAYRKSQVRERLVFTDEVFAMIGPADDGKSPDQSARLIHSSHCPQGMSSKNRELLDWRYQGGRTLEKIAEDIGSNLGNASAHDPRNNPILLAGGGLKHGHYLAHDAKRNTPLCNLFVHMLNQSGLETESFASSTGELAG